MQQTDCRYCRVLLQGQVAQEVCLAAVLPFIRLITGTYSLPWPRRSRGHR